MYIRDELRHVLGKDIDTKEVWVVEKEDMRLSMPKAAIVSWGANPYKPSQYKLQYTDGTEVYTRDNHRNFYIFEEEITAMQYRINFCMKLVMSNIEKIKEGMEDLYILQDILQNLNK